jgi:pyruvate/2-oxoglutarate dehydrogenase complex dihydrolipoamide acyltransferase (E2) component
MPVRKLTLSEWFLAYQMRKMAKHHVHLPSFLDIDVTDIVQRFGDALHGERSRPPYTAILVKGIAMAGRRVPAINVAYFRTFYGDRILAFEDVTVSVPVLLDDGGRRHLSVKSIRGADKLPVPEIHEQIQAARKKKASALKLVRRLAGSSNNFIARTVLKFVHFVVFNFPSVFEKRGGGAFAVSSIVNHDPDAAPVWVPAYAPIAVSVALTAVLHESGRTVLRTGCGFDHTAIDGWVARKFVDALYAILTGKDEEGRRAFDLA